MDIDFDYLEKIRALSEDELTQLAEKGDLYAQMQLQGVLGSEVALLGTLSGRYDFGENSKAKILVSKYMYWLAKASNHDSPIVREAQYNLGLHYRDGLFISKDLYEASCWFEKSAKHGYAPAQIEYAKCLINGDNLPKCTIDEFMDNRAGEKEQFLRFIQEGIFLSEHRERKAFEMIQKAAEQDYPEAFLYMGVCFADGIGVNPNIEIAKDWWKKAALKGSKEAKKILTEFGIYL